jgi:hypothetical protein
MRRGDFIRWWDSRGPAGRAWSDVLPNQAKFDRLAVMALSFDPILKIRALFVLLCAPLLAGQEKQAPAADLSAGNHAGPVYKAWIDYGGGSDNAHFPRLNPSHQGQLRSTRRGLDLCEQ